jgi:uncharacterized surface protein with fasciclin (FAS1) repeats
MIQRTVFLAVAIAILSIGFANAACYINVVEENKSQYEGDLNATMIINNQSTPYSAEIELNNETLDVFPNAAMTTILLNVPADQIESASSEAGNWSILEISEQGQTNTVVMADINESVNASGPVTINFNDSWNGTLPANEEGYVIAIDIENIGEAGNDSAWVTLGFCDDNVTDGNVTPPGDGNVTPPGGNDTDGNVTPPGDGNVTPGDNVTNVTNVTTCYLNIVEEDKTQYDGDLNATMLVNNETTPYTAEIELTNDTQETFPNATLTTIVLNVPMDQIVNANDTFGNEWEITEIVEEEPNPFGNFITMLTINEMMGNPFGNFTTMLTMNESLNETGPVTIYFNDSWNGTFPENDEGYVVAANIEDIGEMGNDSAWVTLGFCEAVNVTDGNVTPPGDGNVTPPGDNDTDGNVTPPGGNDTDGMENITMCYINDVEDNKTEYEGDLNATMMVSNETAPYFIEIELTNETLALFPNTTIETILFNIPADQIDNVTAEYGNWSLVDLNNTTVIERFEADGSNNTSGPITIYMNDTWNGTLPANEDGYLIAVDFQNIGEMGNDSAWVTLGFCEVANETAQEMDIVDTAIDAGSFETLVMALQEANLTETLRGEGPFTVFAPTDEAFDALPEGTLEELLQDPENLTAVLTYHVVPGEYMASDIADIESLTTVQGEDINVTVENDSVMVNNANVTAADIEASNGIIHVIDAVMLPPSMLEEANETDMNDTDENVTDAETEPTAVEIIEDSFDPETTMVMAGETVSWTNMDDEAHTVTAEDGTFDSGEIETGESFNYTFEETGTFDYYCTIHPEMTGSVIVE